MNTFTKYFLHFLLIAFTFFLILIILAIFDKKINLNWISLIIYLFALLIFVLPMSCFFSSEAELVKITVKNDKRGGNLKIVENMIKNECKRTEHVKQGNETIYYMKNRYLRWLTNSISVCEYEGEINIKIPKSYRKSLERKLKCG